MSPLSPRPLFVILCNSRPNACSDVIADTILGTVTISIPLSGVWSVCLLTHTLWMCVCVCVSGVSLPSAGLWHLPPMWLLPGGFLLAVVRPRDRPVSVPARRDWSPVQFMWQPLRWGHKLGLWRWECKNQTFRRYVSLCCIFMNNSGWLNRWLHQLCVYSSSCSVLHLGRATDRIFKKPWEIKHDTAALCPFQNNPDLLNASYLD